jgi:hypothetical protein
MISQKVLKQLIGHCEKTKQLLDIEHPNQKYYEGIVKDIYELMTKIIVEAEQSKIYEKKMNLSSIVRQLADDSMTDYQSNVFTELEKIEEILLKYQKGR